MEAPETRYSDDLKNFNQTLKDAGDVVCADVKDAFEAAVKEATKNGRVDGTAVSLSLFVEHAPAEVKGEAKAFVKRTEQECRYRGEQWQRDALVPCLREYLTAIA